MQRSTVRLRVVPDSRVIGWEIIELEDIRLQATERDVYRLLPLESGCAC